MEQVHTIQSWLAAGLDRSIVFDMVGVAILSVYFDYMQCPHLGIDKVLFGSVLRLLVHHILPSRDPDELVPLSGKTYHVCMLCLILKLSVGT